MENPLDEKYLAWLYARIGDVNESRRDKTYWSLFSYLFTKEFVWVIPNDDNRVEDGRYIRYDFLDDAGLTDKIDPNWLGAGCSVLEMLMGVANRLTFEADSTPQLWFWELLTNLGLSGYTDRGFNERTTQDVEDIVDRFIWRNYQPDGLGGIFPLQHPQKDQRQIEIWYQMNLYLQER